MRPSWLTLNPGMFRLLLAATVMIAHSLPIKFGLSAVYLFFTLSGFWIYTMWHGEYARTANPYRTFIISRVWRLLPVYFVALALFLVVSIALHKFGPAILDKAGAAWPQVIFSNLFILGITRLPIDHRFIQPVWSLDIEIQFYFLAPLLIFLLKKPRGDLLFAAVAAGALICSEYFLVHYEQQRAFSGYLPMYLIFFLIGLATARFRWSPSPAVVHACLAATAVFVGACLAWHTTRSMFLEGSFTTALSDYNPAASFALAILLTPYAMATVNVRTSQRSGWLARIDRDLSNVTYEVYLFHIIIFLIIDRYIAGFSHYKQLPYLFVGYGVVLILSWNVYIYFDRRVDAARRRFVKAQIVNASAISPEIIEPSSGSAQTLS